jgi:hypothetical protein
MLTFNKINDIINLYKILKTKFKNYYLTIKIKGANLMLNHPQLKPNPLGNHLNPVMIDYIKLDRNYTEIDLKAISGPKLRAIGGQKAINEFNDLYNEIISKGFKLIFMENYDSRYRQTYILREKLIGQMVDSDSPDILYNNYNGREDGGTNLKSSQFNGNMVKSLLKAKSKIIIRLELSSKQISMSM